MARRLAQIVPRGEGRWFVCVALGRDPETRRRMYHNRTICGSLRIAQQ
jgi:hypothetical protein